MKTIIALKRQTLLMTGIGEKAPATKANILVREVIVIEGPACFRAFLIRSSGENFNDC